MNVLAQKQLPNSCIYITQFIIPCSSNYILPSNLRGIYVCTNRRNQHTKKIAFSLLSFFSSLFLHVLPHQSLTQSFHIVSFPPPLPLLHSPSPTSRPFASVSSNPLYYPPVCLSKKKQETSSLLDCLPFPVSNIVSQLFSFGFSIKILLY